MQHSKQQHCASTVLVVFSPQRASRSMASAYRIEADRKSSNKAKERYLIEFLRSVRGYVFGQFRAHRLALITRCGQSGELCCLGRSF
jgi:hypothetical protein